MTRRVKISARVFIHARALLLCDDGPDGPAWQVSETSTALGVTSRTIEHIKQRFVEEGLEAALERKPTDKPPRDVRFDGDFEAKLIALACSDAPEGENRWTVRLLADKAVELNFAETISHMTVQRVLKKTNLNHNLRQFSFEVNPPFPHKSASCLRRLLNLFVQPCGHVTRYIYRYALLGLLAGATLVVVRCGQAQVLPTSNLSRRLHFRIAAGA